jgi:hypothetical protein
MPALTAAVISDTSVGAPLGMYCPVASSLDRAESLHSREPSKRAWRLAACSGVTSWPLQQQQQQEKHKWTEELCTLLGGGGGEVTVQQCARVSASPASRACCLPNACVPETSDDFCST